MPGVGEISPYLHVSTYASWNDVGAWYWRLVEESLSADDEIRRTARGLVKRGMTRRRARARRARLRRQGDPVRRARVRHPRLQALQGHAGAGAPLRRLQGQGGADDRAAARGGRSAPSWCWCARGAAGISTPSRRRWRSSITRSSTCPSWIAIWTGPRSSRDWRELPAQDQGVVVLRVGPRGSVLTRDAGAALERKPRRAPLAGGAGGVGRRARRRGADHPRAGGAQLARALPDARASARIATGASGAGDSRARGWNRSRCRASRIGTRP